MKRIVLIRHGESANNAAYAATGLRTGRVAEPELTAVGHRQAAALGEALAGLVGFACAAAACKQRGHKPLHTSLLPARFLSLSPVSTGPLDSNRLTRVLLRCPLVTNLQPVYRAAAASSATRSGASVMIVSVPRA